MSEGSQNDDDYEEEEDDNNSSQIDEMLNEAERWKSVGNKHMAAMEYNKAYNSYSTALKLCPLGPFSHVYLSNRAAALLSLKRYSAAIIDSRRAIALAPTFGKGHARLGQSLYFLKDYAGAIDSYQNALQYEPDNQVTMIYLAKAKRKLERLEGKSKRKESLDTSDAVSVAESTIAFSPETERDHSAAILTGKTNANLAGKLHSAIEHEYPSPTNTTGETNRIVVSTNQPSPKHSKKQMDEAPYDESSGMNKDTIQWAQNHNHVRIAEEFNVIHHVMSEINDEEEEEEEEEDGPDPDFDEALKLRDRASAQLVKKQYRSAVDLYSAALFLVPDDVNLTPHLFVGRANALNGLVRHEGAYNDCKMALSHNPKLAEAHTTMARSLFYLKDYRGAIECFDSAISCLAYGEFLSALDELYYEKAVELSKDQPVENQLVEDDSASAVSSSYHSVRSMGTGKPIPKLNPPRFVSRVEALNTAPVVPSLPKNWANKVPPALSTLSVGPEREVIFVSEHLGVKLNRESDGMIRILYVSNPSHGDSPIVRSGDIAVGDIVREAVGVDLRRPVTSVMWGDTVALIKMADRPITFLVATELSQPPPPVMEEISRALKQDNKTLWSQGTGSSASKLSQAKLSRNLDNYDAMSRSFANGLEPVKSLSKKKQALNNDSGARMAEAADSRHALDHALAQATAVFDHFDLLDDGPKVNSNVSENTEMEHGSQTSAADNSNVNDISHDIDSPVEPNNSSNETLIPEVLPSVVENAVNVGKSKAVKKVRKIPKINLTKWNPLAQATAVLNPIAQATSIFVDALNSNDKVAERSYSDFSEDKEIIFPPALSSKGWDEDSWKATEWSRRLIHSGTIRRWVKGNDLWSEDPTSIFSMALFSDPNIIIIMRFPKNVQEVRALLNLTPDGEPLGKTLDSFMIADEVIDLKTCKLKLSKLTTPTSLCDDNRRSQFFEIITPFETFSIIAKSSNSSSQADILIATSDWEQSISDSLFKTYEQENSSQTIGWKHHVVIGSLHSYIAHKKNNFLQTALSSAKDHSIVDAVDDDGLTPLQFACLRRNSDAVSILLSSGADRFQVTTVGQRSPCHICAQQLDDKTLSVLLSRGHNKPNALDDQGQTPMYLAIIDGKNVNGSSDPQLLKSCLNLLADVGGLLTVESMGSLLPHPIPYLASKWRGAVLSVVLSHSSYRYSPKVSFDGSLSSFYGYPIHICLLSLRDKIAGKNRTERKRERAAPPDDQDLILTLQVLLDHGFEPNERIEYVQKDGVFTDELQEMVGFAPIHILAAASLDLIDLARIGVIKQSVQESIQDLISAAAEVLIRNGSRVNLEVPPKARPQRSYPSFNISSLLSTENQLPKLERSALKFDKNKDLLASLGEDEDIKDDIMTWIETKSVNATDKIAILEKELTSVPDCKGPGGSDANNCAICWKSFKKGIMGAGSKKKYICIISKRFLCDECCTKSLDKNGVSFKISDGQFNLARKDITRQADEEREAENERIRQHSLRVEMAKRAAEREKQDDLFGSTFDSVKGFFNDNVKDIKDLTENIKIRVEGDDFEADEEYVGLGSTLAGARDAFNERGERLNVLRDKSAALKDASQEYLRLAKELQKQQETRGGGFFSR